MIAGIVVGIFGFFVLLGLVIYFVKKARAAKNLPQPEWSATGEPLGYLIPKLLPITPTGLYSVITPYSPSRSDELKLETDHVVAVRETFTDKWALGNNVTTGETGFFPLAVLVSDEKFIEQGVRIPNRYKSLRTKRDSLKLAQTP